MVVCRFHAFWGSESNDDVIWHQLEYANCTACITNFSKVLNSMWLTISHLVQLANKTRKWYLLLMNIDRMFLISTSLPAKYDSAVLCIHGRLFDVSRSICWACLCVTVIRRHYTDVKVHSNSFHLLENHSLWFVIVVILFISWLEVSVTVDGSVEVFESPSGWFWLKGLVN